MFQVMQVSPPPPVGILNFKKKHTFFIMFSEISWDGDSGGGGARFFYRFKGGRDQKSLRTTGLTAPKQSIA